MSISANLSGKSALITGASSGFGAHFSRLLAASGARVVVAARRAERLAALVEEIGEQGGSATAVALDVADPESIGAAVEQAGAIDILVNNAGVSLGKSTLKYDAADVDYIIDTNLKGAFLMATAAARAMRERGKGGSIINIASILGLRPGLHQTVYAMSKAGVIQMTRQLGLELARDDIRVNAIAPGFFHTELTDAFLVTERGQRLVTAIPMKRLGQYPDLDGPLLLLASDASRFMTGSVIAVDGGHLVSSL
jgi:NAD(P)-dependent dehydrogenase (short-subunit alcohol dehydrogenase family)